MEKIDKLDKQILEIISQNARIPFKDVAAECGVSRAAIHQRVQRPIVEKSTTGPYTMLTKLYSTDNEHLMDLLNSKIQEIPGVTATETLISLEQSIKKEIPIRKDADE